MADGGQEKMAGGVRRAPAAEGEPAAMAEKPRAAAEHAFNPLWRQGVPRSAAVAFCVIMLVCMLLPLAGLLWGAGEQAPSEDLAAQPQITTKDGQPNAGFLADVGTWFEDHFAYREQLIEANARLRASVLGISATDQVILGTDGWLYYEGTMSDYLGESSLTQREAYNIAHNLALLQAYVRAQGSQFCFVLAPNKNALYPEYMPYYLQQVDTGDTELLAGYLDELGVSYVDAFGLFENQGGELYFKQDSHWDDEGALLVADALQQELGRDALPWDAGDFVTVNGFRGDLAAMLFPLDAVGEDRDAIPGVSDGEGRTGSEWSFVEGSSVTDDFIRTSGAGEGALVMFRDSFANNLAPYFAATYDTALFSKLVPYNALLVAEESPDCVIVERTQRHVGYLAEEAFAMPSPSVSTSYAEVGAGAAGGEGGVSVEPDSVSAVANGPLTGISGALQGNVAANARVYVRVSSDAGMVRMYEAFTLGDGTEQGGNEFLVYLGTSTWAGSGIACQVFVEDGDVVTSVGSFEFTIE